MRLFTDFAWSCPTCGRWHRKTRGQQSIYCRRCQAVYYQTTVGFWTRKPEVGSECLARRQGGDGPASHGAGTAPEAPPPSPADGTIVRELADATDELARLIHRSGREGWKRLMAVAYVGRDVAARMAGDGQGSVSKSPPVHGAELPAGDRAAETAPHPSPPPSSDNLARYGEPFTCEASTDPTTASILRGLEQSRRGEGIDLDDALAEMNADAPDDPLATVLSELNEGGRVSLYTYRRVLRAALASPLTTHPSAPQPAEPCE